FPSPISSATRHRSTPVLVAMAIRKSVPCPAARAPMSSRNCFRRERWYDRSSRKRRGAGLRRSVKHNLNRRPGRMEAGDVSRYSSLDATNDPGFFVELMDSFRTVPTFAELKRMMLDQVAPAAGQRVLDVGCGPGDDTRQIAARLVPGGLAVGLDRSAVMVGEARRRAGGSGLPLEFHTGDACALEFPDATFDACRAERVLVHVNDPGRAVAEMTRVTRPGGRVVAFDGDSVTVTID